MERVTKVFTVLNEMEARQKIADLKADGYDKDQLFILTHDDKRTERLAEQAAASEIGMKEEGVFTAVANLFRSQGDELRAKLRSMGVSESYAEALEVELDRGKIVILAWRGVPYEPTDSDYDHNIQYYPPMMM